MDPIDNEIVQLMTGESCFSAKNKQIKIYYWLVNDGNLDLYKYCKLSIHIRKNYDDYDPYTNFLRYYDLPVTRELQLITKDMVEFYKDKSVFVQGIFDDYIIREYSIALFGFSFGINAIHCGIDKLDTPKIKFILNFIYNSSSFAVDLINHCKFLVECKKLGYNKDKLMKKLRINEHKYNMIDDDYIEYLQCNKISYSEYLQQKEFKNLAKSCISYIDALYNSGIDIGADEVTVSMESLRSITSLEAFKLFA